MVLYWRTLFWTPTVVVVLTVYYVQYYVATGWLALVGHHQPVSGHSPGGWASTSKKRIIAFAKCCVNLEQIFLMSYYYTINTYIIVTTNTCFCDISQVDIKLVIIHYHITFLTYNACSHISIPLKKYDASYLH